MNYFRLFPDCIFLEGYKGGAIYFLSENRVIDLSYEEKNMLRYLLNEGSIAAGENIYGKEIKYLLTRLIQKKLGTLYPGRVASDHYYPRCQWEMRGYLEEVPDIREFFIQLNNDCTLECQLCADDRYIHNGCKSCARWPLSRQVKGNFVPATALEDILKLKPQRLIFAGGDPLLRWGELIDMVQIIKEKIPEQKIQINCNGLSLQENIIEEGKAYNLDFSITLINYSKIFGSTEGEVLLQKIRDKLCLCEKYSLTYHVCILIEAGDGRSLYILQDFLENQNPRSVVVAESVREKSYESTLISKRTSRDKVKPDLHGFFQNQKFHPCLNGRLALDHAGQILACPMLRESAGAYPGDNIKTPFRNGRLDVFWRSKKDNLQACKDCQYRYLCRDCAVMEQAVEEGILNKNIYCTFSGESEEGRGNFLLRRSLSTTPGCRGGSL